MGKLQIRRGNQSALPVLDSGEPGLSTDTNRLYIGTPTGNREIQIIGDASSYTLYVATVALGGRAESAGATGRLIRSSTATSTTANKLVDSGATFTSATHLNKTLYNSTDDTWAKITAIDSTTQVSISDDIMASGEYYVISNAYSTVQEAINAVPVFVNSNVSIRISNGTFAENVTYRGKISGAYSLYIYGTLTLLELVSSATVAAGTGATQGAVTSVGSFAGNSYANKLAYFVTDGVYRLIDSHTNDVLTIVGTAASSTAQDVKIYDWGTLISFISSAAMLTVSNQKNLYIYSLAMHNGTNTNRAFAIDSNSSAQLLYCSIDGTILINTYSGFTFDTSFTNANTALVPIHCQGGSVGDSSRSKHLAGATAQEVLRAWGASGYNLRRGTIIDGNGFTPAYGFNVFSNGYGNCYAAASDGYPRIRNCNNGLRASSGGMLTNTADIQYSGNTTNESADATSYGYID